MSHQPPTPEELELDTWKEKLLYKFILEKKEKLRYLEEQAVLMTITGFIIGFALGAAVSFVLT